VDILSCLSPRKKSKEMKIPPSQQAGVVFPEGLNQVDR
jgi:hypothetical protein